MADTRRLTRLIQDVRRALDEISGEIRRLEESEVSFAPTGRSGSTRAARTTAGAEGPPNVIPPTRTEEPQSIVGGRATLDFPDCCAVGDSSGYFCTGTLIAPNVVVTAGHCDGSTRVFIAGHDVRRPADGETIDVQAAYTHDQADLQVLVLKGNARTAPRHVAQGREVPRSAPGLSCRLVGFGTIDLGGRVGYGLKRQVDVPIASLSCGTRLVARRFGCEQGTETVAGQRGLNRDSCRGDSGGPLYVQSPQGDYFLLGATSRGVTNARNVCGDGGIYVRVDKYLDWIRQKTGVAIEGPRV